MLVSLVHKGLCRLQILFAWFSRPEKMRRTEKESKLLAKETSGISLYDYKWCAASLKARHEIYYLNIEIERRDIQRCSVHQDNLLAQFGRLKAPCLRIEEQGKIQWLDEPDEIVHYLHQRFGKPAVRLSA